MIPHSQFAEQYSVVMRELDKLFKITTSGVAPEGDTFESFRAKIIEGARMEGGIKIVEPPQGSDDDRGSGFRFGKTSEKELIGVNADLVRCVRMALEHSTIDFMVFDGIRSVEEQRAHVKNGTSKTMQSKHLDGLAVDLVPFIDGGPKWDWDGCYRIACAMDHAASFLGIAHRITWGGAWDRKLSDIGGGSNLSISEAANRYKQVVEEYKARHPGPDFIDGPHFEILP